MSSGPTTHDISCMLRAYIECALWSSNDESTPSGGEPFDANYGPENLANSALDTMRRDVERFARENYETIQACADRCRLRGGESTLWEQAGHDFWLTRNHHGCGFWETPDWPEKEGAKLTDNAHAFGETYLYLGDDGLIYCD